MCARRQRQNERGVVFLLLLVLIVLALIGGALLMVMRSQSKKPVSTTAAEVVEAGTSALNRKAQNTIRQTDANILLAAANASVANNGLPPTALDPSMLKGMGYYSSVSVAQGKQVSLHSDELRLVTGALCGQEGATVSVQDDTSLAVQYTIQNGDGSFAARCVDS